MQEEQNIQEEQELYENYRVIVDKGQSLLRIDKYLVDRIEGASRNKIQLAIKADCVKVNDKTVKVNYRVKPGDLIQVFLTTEPREIEIIPQNIPIDIVYEDKDVIVVNKPAGMVVHPGYGNYTSTLLNALTYHFQQNESSEVKPLLVHRIDKDTSGLLVVAMGAAMLTGCGSKEAASANNAGGEDGVFTIAYAPNESTDQSTDARNGLAEDLKGLCLQECIPRSLPV